MADYGQDQQRRDKGPNIIGPYRVGNIIGKGGFGSVYKALDVENGTSVAIKQMGHTRMSGSDLGCIEMEISLLSKLKHRNIVKYIDSIRTQEHLNIVLEFIEGGSLASMLKKFMAFPEKLCAIYTWQMLQGLSYLHSQGVVHRDIKGANVLTTKDGTVKLADFGVATTLADAAKSQGSVVGTPYWMAPEIIEMSPPTPACDLWSVGSTVVEMITESPPYWDMPQMSALYRIVSDLHPPLPDGISHGLQSFLLACWEKNPNLRAPAGDLLEHEWIQANKKHCVNFQKKNVQQAPVEVDREQREQQIDEEEEEVDEDMAAVRTLVATITCKDQLQSSLRSILDPPLPKERSGELNASRAAAPAMRQRSFDRPADDEPVVAAAAVVARQVSVATPAAGLPPIVPQEEPTHLGSAMAATLEVPPLRLSLAESRLLTWPRAQEPTHLGSAMAATLEGSAEIVDSATTIAGPSSEQQVATTAALLDDDVVAPLPLPPTPSATGPRSAVSERAIQLAERGGGLAGVSLAGAELFRIAEFSRTVVDLRAQIAQALHCHPAMLKFLQGGEELTERHIISDFASVIAQHRQDGDVPAPLQSTRTGPPVGQRDAAEIKQLLGSIRPFEEPAVLVNVCKRLTELLQQDTDHEESKLHLVLQHGAVPIAEMLQVTDPALLRAVLKMVNQLADGSEVAQELFATVGLIPAVIKFAQSQYSPHLRREAAHFIARLCNTSPRSLQMLVACGGLEALADLVAHDYYNNRDLVWLALDALARVFDSAWQSCRNNDFCRILAKHGLCGHLCTLIDTLASDIHERAARYLKVVVDLLLFFAKEGDAIVKVYMAKGAVLEGFISALEFLPLDLSVQIFKTFKWLAQEPSVLNMLENAGVVPVLVHFLSSLCSVEAVADSSPDNRTRTQSGDACSQCIQALFHLCKLSRPRQEQAALAGAVLPLHGLVERGHGLKVYAFVMLCDMTSASLSTRRILWSHEGVDLLVRSFRDLELQVFALEALVGWLAVKEHRADWLKRLEGVLLQERGGAFLPELLELFKSPDATVFMKVLEQLLKLARLSERLVAALAKSDEFFQVATQRLQPAGHQLLSQLPRRDAEGSPTLPGSAASTIVAAPMQADVATVAAAASGAAAGLPRFTSSGSRSRPTPTGVSGSVQRLVSMPADVRYQDDDEVRLRKNLLNLLLQICQGLEKAALAALCQRHRLPLLINSVLKEEELRKQQRVILKEFASQLLELFRKAQQVTEVGSQHSHPN